MLLPGAGLYPRGPASLARAWPTRLLLLLLMLPVVPPGQARLTHLRETSFFMKLFRGLACCSLHVAAAAAAAATDVSHQHLCYCSLQFPAADLLSSRFNLRLLPSPSVRQDIMSVCTSGTGPATIVHVSCVPLASTS